MTNPHHPAFLPEPKVVYLRKDTDCDVVVGLTKREHFAAMAMQGNICGRYSSGIPSLIHIPLSELSTESIAMADALIADLSK